MSDNPVFPADGEKLSTEQIHSTHVPHPGVDEFFRRSALMIGTRGSGKTFLLRHRKLVAHPGAVYINLVKCLQSLSRDSGLGGRTLHYSDSQRAQIRAKAAALIAATAVEQLLKDQRWAGRTPLPLGRLAPLLTSDIDVSGNADLDTVTALRRQINQKRLRDWANESIDSWLLAEILCDIGNALEPPLALFLDRAEDAPAPALQLLLPLLDQSVEFLTVIAARPGLAQLVPDELDPTLVPGDHFDIVHLGSDPYDQSWITFSASAVRNYLDANGVNLDDDQELTWSSRMARDSVRSAVTLTQIGLATRGKQQRDRRSERLTALRDHQLATIRAELQPEHPDFAATVRLVRQRFHDELLAGTQQGVLINVSDADEQLSLVRQRGQLTDFLLKAIRCEALYLPPGHLWHPFQLPITFELPPLLAWDSRNTSWIS